MFVINGFMLRFFICRFMWRNIIGLMLGKVKFFFGVLKGYLKKRKEIKFSNESIASYF